MGALFSRLRKKKETTEILEELDSEIKNCINFRLENQENQKRWVGRFTMWGLTLYVLFALLYYLMYFPVGWVERIVYSTILIVVPVMLILASRRSLMWYYSRKITNNEEKLLLLKEEKQRILEEVMENETYKKAKEILDKHDPERFKTMTPPRAGAPSNPSTPGCEIRQRKGGSNLQTPKAPAPPSAAALAIGPPPPNSQSSATPSQNTKILRPPKNTPILPNIPVRSGAVQMLPNGPPPMKLPNRGPPVGSPMLTRPPVLPRPVLQPDRGVLDRMVEYLVGDGPANRYALVCRRCHRHNGMALKEEFEYLAFHCAYCQFLNPAKRKRPCAPRLPESSPPSGRDSDAGSESDFGASSSNVKLTSSPSAASVDEKNDTSEVVGSTTSVVESGSAGDQREVDELSKETNGEELEDHSIATQREPGTEATGRRGSNVDSTPETNVERSTSLAESDNVEDPDVDSGAEVGIAEDARDESTDAMEVETLS